MNVPVSWRDRLLGYLDKGRWEDLARELMLLYYDPLYRHTCPEQRITVTMADAEPDLTALKRAIAQILKHPPGDPAGAEEQFSK